MVVNIFEMGSLLDAYGIYSNYLTPALEQARSERTVSLTSRSSCFIKIAILFKLKLQVV